MFEQGRRQLVPGKSLVGEVAEKWLFQEGVYLFGGKDEYAVFNDLYILKLDSYPVRLEKPSCAGRGPESRYGHAMVFNREVNLLIIHGGVNIHSSRQAYFNDMYALKLNSLSWVRVQLFNQQARQRAFF